MSSKIEPWARESEEKKLEKLVKKKTAEEREEYLKGVADSYFLYFSESQETKVDLIRKKYL